MILSLPILAVLALLAPQKSCSRPLAPNSVYKEAHGTLTSVGQIHYYVNSQGGSSLLPFRVSSDSESINDDSDLLVYSPAYAWTRTLNRKTFSKGSSHWTSEKGASVELAFKGSMIEVSGSVGPDHGIIEVTVDSKQTHEIDLYSPKAYFGQALFRSLDLGSGNHTVQIVNTGDRHNLSTATYFDIDTLGVTP